MKRCATPHNTTCMYQRPMARDEAPDVDPDVVQQAFADLYDHLSNDADGLALLKHLMNSLSPNDGLKAMDGRYAADSAVVRRAQSQAALVRSGRVQAEAYDFAKRFPGAARIRNV